MRSARLTVESAKHDISVGDHVWACFKSQQAAEKALKAFLWGVGEPATGHSLVKLLNVLKQKLGHEAPSQIKMAVSRLSKYYIPTRYPNAWSEGIPEEHYTKEESEEAVELAETILRWVEELWKKLEKGE
jgi:HEPN domain-containing protein